MHVVPTLSEAMKMTSMRDIGNVVPPGRHAYESGFGRAYGTGHRDPKIEWRDPSRTMALISSLGCIVIHSYHLSASAGRVAKEPWQ